MVHTDECGYYVEDRGCYYALLLKIRENRRMVVISLLLTVVVVAVVAGLYHGVTLKEYNNWAVTVGIFFPSVVLVFICIYVAFACGQASVSSTVLPSFHHLQNENQSVFYEHEAQQHRGSPANLRVRYQSKHSREPMENSPKCNIEQTTDNRLCEESESTLSDYATKRHFRSLSNSDISRYRNRNIETLRGYERPGSTTCREDKRYSKHTRCQSVPKCREFKRCVSDTAYKYRNAKTKEDARSENTGRHGKKLFSIEDDDQTSSEGFSEILEHTESRSLYSMENLRRNKTSDDYEKMISYEFMNEVERERYRQEVCADKYSSKSIRGENWMNHFTKSDMPHYPSSKIENPQEFGYPLNFPRVSLADKDFNGNENTGDCSFIKNEQYASLSSDLPRNDKGFKCILSQRENSINKHLKGKEIYYTSAKEKESVHVSDNYKYFAGKSKMNKQSTSNGKNVKRYM